MNIAAGDVLPAFDADAGAAPRGSANIRHFSRMELPGGGQIVIQGTTAFVGHQVGPEGTTILDISDPRKPKVLSQIMCSHPWSHTHKVRVAGDIMVVNSEREPGKGNAHNKVRWTTTTTSAATAGYILSWKVADGWKICGAQAAILGYDDQATFDLAMEVGYTSQGNKGSTVTSGSETIRTELSKQDCQELGIDPQFKGNWGIRKIYAVTVFIKKDKK